MFILFRGLDGKLDKLDPEFILLFGTSIVLFAGVTVLARRCGFYAGWSWLAPFAFSAFLLLINTNYTMAANYRNLLFQGLALPRYFLGAFGVTGIMLVIALCYSYRRPAASLWWLDIINLLLIALALIDLRLTQIMGVRLDWQVLKFGDDPKMIWRMARPYLPSAGMLLLGMAAFYATALWRLRRWRQWAGKRLEPGNGSSGLFILLLFLLLGLAGRWLVSSDKALGETVVQLVETSPLWKKAVGRIMSKEAFLSTAQQLGLEQLVKPVFPAHSQPPRELNVVLIFQESSYNKYLSLFDGKEETQPLLSKYKDRMELFPNFFSNFAGSIWARFAAFSGLYPVQDFNDFTIKRINVKSIFDILHENGYDCSMFYSSSFDYTGFRDFLKGRGIDKMYDADTMPGQRKTAPVSWGLREEETLGAIQEQIKKYAAGNQKFFITYVPAAPHYPFDAIPDRFRKFHMGQIGDYSPLYLNELLYMDWVMTSIVDELKDSGLLDKTLVVITDDHGEMLGVDGGQIGHGWAVTPELENIPLIIIDPEKRGYRLNDTVGSQVDLLPTIMDILRIPVPPGQLYEGTSLFFKNDTNRLVYLNSFSQYMIARDGELIWGDRAAKTGDAASDSERVFTITNDGAHTSFKDSHPSEAPKLFMARFDQFQENFLQNYSYYCEMMQQHEIAGKTASK
jgi:arylsulfatase A-like enzyme